MTARCNGERSWACSGVTGEEFSGPDHVYANDLGVFGEDLFSNCFVSPNIDWAARPCEYLLEAPLLEETLLRKTQFASCGEGWTSVKGSQR